MMIITTAINLWPFFRTTQVSPYHFWIFVVPQWMQVLSHALSLYDH